MAGPKPTDWYDDNASEYFHDTVGVDMAALRDRFMAHVPSEGHILDAGCGSGRDSLAFRQAGYRVTAFDGSPRLADLATQHLGQRVPVMAFQDVSWHAAFDGIWACASLLHVPRAELPEVLQRLGHALRTGSVMYVSFKYGTRDRMVGDRHFTDLDEPGLAELLQRMPELTQLECWRSDDRRPGRAQERWLNALLGKA